MGNWLPQDPSLRLPCILVFSSFLLLQQASPDSTEAPQRVPRGCCSDWGHFPSRLLSGQGGSLGLWISESRAAHHFAEITTSPHPTLFSVAVFK